MPKFVVTAEARWSSSDSRIIEAEDEEIAQEAGEELLSDDEFDLSDPDIDYTEIVDVREATEHDLKYIRSIP